IHDINQITMFVQGGTFESHFGLIMMRVPLILCAPITANEEMLRDKVPCNGHSVHGESLLLPLRGQRGRSLTRPLPFMPRMSGALVSLPPDAGRAGHRPGLPASGENDA